MTTKFEEIILEEIFKLSGKIDKIQDEMRGMATKDDIQNMATKDDIKNMATKDDIKNMATKDDIKNMATKDDIKNMATKDDIKNMATKTDLLELEKRMDQKFDNQAKEIAEMFTDTFKLSSKYHRELEERITKATDIKIENLRKEFIRQKV